MASNGNCVSSNSVGHFVSSLILTGLLLAYPPPMKARQADANNSISGRVLATNGDPVAGALVILGEKERRSGVGPVAVSDEQGAFRFAHVRSGSYSLTAEHRAKGYPYTGFNFYTSGALDIPTVTLGSNEQVNGIVIRFAVRASRLVCHVVDAKDDKPIAEWAIQLSRLDAPDRYVKIYPNDVDEVGTTGVLVPPSTPVTITVTSPGYVDWSYEEKGAAGTTRALQLEPDGIRDLVIKLQPVRKLEK